MKIRTLNTQVLGFLMEFKNQRPERYAEIREYAKHCRENLRGLNSEILFARHNPKLVEYCANTFGVDTFTVIRTLVFEKSNACVVCGKACDYVGSKGPLNTCSTSCHGVLKAGKRHPRGLCDNAGVHSNSALLSYVRRLRTTDVEDYELLVSIVKSGVGSDARTVMYEVTDTFPDIGHELSGYGSAAYVFTTLLTNKKNVCAECGEPTKVTPGFRNNKVKFAEFCGTSCSNANQEKKKKYEATCMARYGVKNSGMFGEFIEKQRDRSVFTGCTSKPWVDAKGVEHIVQGYEPITNSYLQDKHGACNFKTKGVGRIRYVTDKPHWYLPDAMCTIKGKRYLVETKGDYTLRMSLATNLAKFKAANKWCKRQPEPTEFVLCIALPDKGKVRVIRSPSTRDVQDFINS